MSDLPLAAIWLTAVLLLSILTIPVCAVWHRKEGLSSNRPSKRYGYPGAGERVPGCPGVLPQEGLDG